MVYIVALFVIVAWIRLLSLGSEFHRLQRKLTRVTESVRLLEEQLKKTAQRLAELEQGEPEAAQYSTRETGSEPDVAAPDRPPDASEIAPSAVSPAIPPPPVVAPPPTVPPPAAVPPPPVVAPPSTVAPPPLASPPPAPAADSRPAAPPEPNFAERFFQTAKAWLLGGNTLVRIGLVILFLGLAFLLRLFNFPTKIRYICVALAAFALLAFGWRLRHKNPAYGLLLQGGGIGVLYLTSFAALRLALPALLSPGSAFGLMVLMTVAAVALALLQDSMALACAAALGAFAAPILASSGSGDHVALFSYFAMLNTGIALVAWFKAWRPLNLIGFFGTFSVGLAWGLSGYTSEKFASTQPFLALFFLMFVLIGMLFARRKLMALSIDDKEFVLSGRSPVSTDYIDGTLVFGPPLIGFGLQCAIVSHIEFGAAYSAAALGLFYIALAYCMRRREEISLMMEVCLALGVVFGTLAIPLAFGEALWTSAAWALEAAGIYWIGHVQGRKTARYFAMTVLVLASLTYLKGLDIGYDALLDGSPLGAALLGLAWLFCFHTLRRAGEGSKQALPVLAAVGLSFVYLVAPLCLGRENTVIAWALAGMATVYLGSLLGSRTFIACAFTIQALAALLFVSGIGLGEETILDAGWLGAFIALLLGVALIANVFLAFSRNKAGDVQTESGEGEPLASARMSKAAMLISMVFFIMAFAFILDWNYVGATWAGIGVLLVCMGLWQNSPVPLFFGLLLELIAGVAFLTNLQARFVQPNGWIPAVIALAAFIGAWRLHHVAQRLLEQDSMENTPPPLPPGNIAAWSNILLTWGAGWWIWCAIERIGAYSRLFANTEILYLPVIALTAVIWMIAARLAWWERLALFCVLLIEASGLALVKIGFDLSLLSTAEWIAYFTLHFAALWFLSETLSAKFEKAAHVLGAWLLVFFLTLAASFAVQNLVLHPESAWRWLGWALASSLYVWLMASARTDFWPLEAFPRQYQYQAALPVVIAMLCWFWIANLLSSGNPAPLPYLPLINPLEIGMLIVLFCCVRWSRFHLQGDSSDPARVERNINIAAVLSLFAMLTQTVSRTAHAFGGVEFNLDALKNSMGVQAGWSIVWTLFALTLMIGGSLRKHRGAWIAGAVLSGVVVVKLFLVDLGSQGGVSRVISFIGVGALLLIVGYFAPLPPRADSPGAETEG